MKENDPLKPILQEWEAPDPPPSLDARVRANYRAVHRPPLWRRLWTTQVSVPVPALAALLLLAVALSVQFWLRPQPSQPATVTPSSSEHITRIEAAGFKPLPDGATRIIRAGQVKQ